jgi:hypothetical protein
MKVVKRPIEEVLNPELWFKINEEVDLELVGAFYGMDQLEDTVRAFLEDWGLCTKFYTDIRLDFDGGRYRIIG